MMRAKSDVVAGDPFGTAKLLIIDDDPMTCQLLALQLEMEGYSCTTLSGPKQAMEVIAAESPALILVDFHLGTHGGLDLMHSIRSHEKYRNLPVVVMSGLDRQKECESAGADGFVLKPFNLQDLLTTIQDVLKRQEV
jgi:DNA-binding response OmpR family regulator